MKIRLEKIRWSIYLIASRISDGICFRGDLLRLSIIDRVVRGPEHVKNFTFDDEQRIVYGVNDLGCLLHHKWSFHEQYYWHWIDWHLTNFCRCSKSLWSQVHQSSDLLCTFVIIDTSLTELKFMNGSVGTKEKIRHVWRKFQMRQWQTVASLDSILRIFVAHFHFHWHRH